MQASIARSTSRQMQSCQNMKVDKGTCTDLFPQGVLQVDVALLS